MAARLIDGIQYVKLTHDNSLKNKSLEDNVYFTLRDIWLNAECIDYCYETNQFNSILTDNICYEDRKEDFKYSNILYNHNSNYLTELYEWLGYIDGRFDRKKHKTIDYIRSLFTFEIPDEDEDINMNKYMRADEWWVQMVNLIDQLEKLLEKHKKHKE
jgi:hypothetical protein